MKLTHEWTPDTALAVPVAHRRTGPVGKGAHCHLAGRRPLLRRCAYKVFCRFAGRLVLVMLVVWGAGCIERAPSRPPLHLVESPYVTLSNAAPIALASPAVLGGEERPCLTAPTPAEMRFRIAIPPRALLTFALGIGRTPSRQTDANNAAARKIRFRVRVGENEPSTEIFSRDIHLSRADQWIDQSVDLSRFSQKVAWLSFETFAVDRNGSRLEEASSPFVGLFGEPILHDRARYRESRGVVLVSIDTLRRDHVGLYGYERQTTPGLDRLAEESVVFEDAVSTASWTLPAHASLFTSLYPSYHGAVNLHRGLSESFIGLPKILHDNGFLTQAVVTHLYLSKQYGFGEGFDRHLFLPQTRAEAVTDRGLGFLRSHGDRDFFVFLHYYDPHWHYDPPPPYDRFFDPDYSGTASGIWWDFKNYTRETIDPRDLEHIVALYDGEIRYVDEHVDRLLREMKQLGVFDNALVVVISDHGEEFLDHGGWEHQKTLYEEQIRVPLIIKLPGGAHRRERLSRQVSLIDVAPTVLDVLTLPQNSAFQGQSLLPLLGRAAKDSPQGEVWAETEHTVDGSHKLALRRGATAEKLIYSVRDRASGDTSVELYDLGQDAGETMNLVAASPNAAAGKLSRLEDFLDRIADFRRKAPPAKPVDLSPEQLDKLRALGYVR